MKESLDALVRTLKRESIGLDGRRDRADGDSGNAVGDSILVSRTTEREITLPGESGRWKAAD